MLKRSLFFLFGFLAVSLLLTVIFWGSIKQTFFEWTLKEYCKKCLGYRIAYEKLVVHDRNIIELKELKVLPYASEQFSCGTLLCPSALVSVKFDLQSRILETDVYLEDFVLNLEDPAVGSKYLVESFGKSQKLFFEPRLNIQGKGRVVSDGEASSLSMDLEFGSKILGRAQIDRALVQFSLGEEGESLLVMGDQVDGRRFMNMAQKVVPFEWPFSVGSGTLSGVLAIQEGQLCGGVEGYDLTVHSGSLTGRIPRATWECFQKEHSLSFQDGKLLKDGERARDIRGTFYFDGEQGSFSGCGAGPDVEWVSRLKFTRNGFLKGSKIQLASPFFEGEVALMGKTGYAHINGSCDILGIPLDLTCFDIEAELNPSWCGLGCEGKVVFFDENNRGQSLNFHFFVDQEFHLRDGSFQGDQLNISTLPQINPWGLEIDLDGTVDLAGEFDQSHANFTLRTRNLSFTTDQGNFSTRHPFSLHMTFPFDKEGFLVKGAVDQGSIYLKKADLEFNFVSANFQGDKNKLFFERVRAESGDISVGGDILLTLSPELNIEIYQHTLDGKVSAIQEVLSKMGAAHPLLKLPLEGNLTYQDEGAFFKWSPGNGGFQGTVGARLIKGGGPILNTGAALKDLDVYFVYDVATDYLEVREGFGSLALKGKEAMPLHLDQFTFHDVSGGLVEFDFWGGDKMRDVFRISGHTTQGREGLCVLFDKEATHIGAIYPKKFDLYLDPSGEVAECHFKTDFQIENIEKDLKRFMPIVSHQGILFSLKQIFSGRFSFLLDYKQGKWDCCLEGNQVLLAGKPFQNLLFLGSMEGNEYQLHQLRLDDFSLAADCSWVDNGYDIKFLGGEWGDTSLIGMDGHVSPNFDRIEANLNLVDIDLSELKNIKGMQGFFHQFNPQGHLRVKGGKLTMNLDEGEWDIGLSFLASLKDSALNGIPFYDIEKIAVDYQTDKHLSITGLKSVSGSEGAIKVDLDLAEINLQRNELIIDQLSFQIPERQMGALTQLLEKAFPGSIQSSIGSILHEIKPAETLKGHFYLHINPLKNMARIHFEDGAYKIFGHSFNLRDFKLSKKDDAIDLSAKGRLLNRWMTFKTGFLGRAFPQGILEIAMDKDESLSIWWKRAAERDPRIFIEKVEGGIAGARLSLKRVDNVLLGFAKGDDIFANLEIDSHSLSASDIWVKFRKGSITCSRATIKQNAEGEWMYFIPSVYGRSVHPGSLGNWNQLIDQGIVVDQMEFKGIQGTLTKPHLISGKGALSFSSPNKPEVRAFPFVKEKIQDLSLLRPISGTLEFEVDKGNWSLTGLNQVVDKRKLFRYTLPSRGMNSLSPDGQLRIVVNLLPNHQKVKMGDHVSIVVEGTWDFPKFSLQKTGDVLSR